MNRSRFKRRYVTRSSAIHGKGVFAKEPIRKGTRIIEYRGVRSTMEVACERPHSDPANPHHTFIFELSDGTVIDGGVRGNAARWINHSCDPNCEAIEEDGRMFIHAKRYIPAGEELVYDYQLTFDGPLSKRAEKAHSCRCGTDRCRGSMLEKPKKRGGAASARSR
jgi:SET domain-containing protein